VFKLSGFLLLLGFVFLSVTLYSYFLCQKKIIDEYNSLYFDFANNKKNQNDILIKSTAEITNITELKNLIDERIVKKTPYAITKEIQQVVRESFIHGIGFLYPCENWLLFLISQVPIDKIKIKRLNAILDVNRLLESPITFCSQNALVVQYLLNSYNIEFSSVAVGTAKMGHFASAAKINDEWYFLDGNIEYNMINQELTKLSDFLNPDNEDLIHQMYGFHPEIMQAIIKGRKTGEMHQFSVNKWPATRGLLFQNLTKVISNWMWLVFFILYFISVLFRANTKFRS